MHRPIQVQLEREELSPDAVHLSLEEMGLTEAQLARVLKEPYVKITSDTDRKLFIESAGQTKTILQNADASTNLIDIQNRISYLQGFLARNSFRDDSQWKRLKQEESMSGQSDRLGILSTTRGNLEERLADLHEASLKAVQAKKAADRS